MWEKGSSEKALFEELEARLSKDYGFGTIIGSMCTASHPLVRKVYAKFIDSNLGDPGLFPAVAGLEQEAIRMIGMLLSNPEAVGNIVTGGTEANLLAMWTAKKLAKKEKDQIIVPSSAHCSFDKAADLLGLNLVKVRLNERFQINIEGVKKAIVPNTLAIVGIAGTTGLGTVDPIPELSEIAIEENLYLHVDAAFGGFVLPFLTELKSDVPKFDFSLPGVSSITIDPHKMGLAPIPAGGILFRHASMRKAIAWNVAYLAGGETKQTTLVGTRSGASVIAVWALLRHLGREGYTKIVEQCMHLTRKLAKEIQKIKGLDIMTVPVTNVVGLKSEMFDIRLIAQELRCKGWAVALFPTHIRVVVMPHVQQDHVERFLEDLSKIADRLHSRREGSIVRTSI